MTASGNAIASARTFAADVINGFLEVTHNGFALLGLAVAFGAIALSARPDLRQAGEDELRGWLHERRVAEVGFPLEPTASERAVAINPKKLPREQAAVAFWLSKKYRVAPEPLAALVTEAYEIGKRTKLDPTLILAIIAIESSFNPFAQSSVGAQGLMQVMTSVHTDKYEGFGGQLAAFDPVANLREGVKELQEIISRIIKLVGKISEIENQNIERANNLLNDFGSNIKRINEGKRANNAYNNAYSLNAPSYYIDKKK